MTREISTPTGDNYLQRALVAGSIVAATGALAACGGNESASEPNGISAIESNFNLELSGYDWQPPETFTVGDRKVTIISEAGLTTDSFTKEKISSDVDNSLKLTRLGEMPIKISMPGDKIELGFSLVPSVYKAHDFVIFEDVQSPTDVAGQNVPAAYTIINLNQSGTEAVEALTVLASYGDEETVRFGNDDLKPDVFNLAVETCNNLTDVDFPESTKQWFTSGSGDATESQGVETIMTKLVKEAACNGFAAITATKEAGYSYAEYVDTVSKITLGSTANMGLPFEIPYTVYPKEVWDQL